MVQAQNLTRQVPSPEGVLTLLDDINLSIAPGEAVAIVGASGSGKSTLLGLLAGLDVPSSGRVLLDGTELSALDEDGRARLRAGRVGFVFQSFQLLPGLTALENVMLPLELAGHASPAAAARDVLAQVELGARLHHYPSQLSGGEQQRVAIARAIAKRPEVLLCDEPTGALDISTGVVVLEALERVNRELGTCTAVITHNAAIASMSDRVIRLSDGHIAGIESNPEKRSPRELQW